MSKSLKKKISFRSVPKDNKALTSELRKFVDLQKAPNVDSSSTGGLSSQLEAILERLYVHICEFGLYFGDASTPDKIIFAAWESFLDPINALTALQPHGHMIAARMTLYLTEAYRKQGQLPRVLPMAEKSADPIALRCNFAISLDDLLLSCLTQIWSHSNKRELFNWVFTGYPVKVCGCSYGTSCEDYIGPGNSVRDFHEQRRRDHIKTACITNPSGLTPENGVQPRRRWTRTEGDTTQYPRHPDSSCFGYQESADGERMLMWQDIGSDGPIRESYHYELMDEDTRETIHRERAALRRSRQFVLDARKIAECNLARDSRRIAQVIMARKSLPVELQLMIFENLEDIQEHPYVGKLDLTAVYRPFPETSKKCRLCTGRAGKSADIVARATCPLNSITIWSLPLRVFHTFHQTDDWDWQLCPHMDCPGHHRDSSWRLQNMSIENHLDSILQRRCGRSLTIGDIGLGPLEPAELPSAAEDWDRERRLFSGYQYDDDETRDDRDEARWGGVAGLAGVMLHNETLLGLHSSGRTTTEPYWLLGRTRREESRACAALARDHVHCEFC